MARIMREVIRQSKREALRRRTAVSFAFDDQAGYKLVRVWVDALSSPVSPGPPAASQGGAQGGGGASPMAATAAVEGTLGCIRCLRGSSLEDLADDYAVRTSQEVLALLARFCTPLGDEQDVALYRHI